MPAFKIEEKQPALANAMKIVGKHRRISHAYLFEGDSGAGQEEMATFIAAMVFCTKEEKPCGECEHCRRILNHDYGDVLWVEPTEGSMKIDQMRAVKQDLSLSAIESHSKVFVINHAELMTTAAANSLLKFLEEPNANVHLLLLTTNRDRILPTIQSRCQIIHFPALERQQVIQMLIERGMGEERAQLLSALTSDIALAETLNEQEIFSQQIEKVWSWTQLILKKDIRSFILVGSEWVKLTKDRQETKRLLALVLLYCSDLLKLKQGEGEDRLIQPTLTKSYYPFVQTIALESLLQIMQSIAKTQAMIEHNVTVQAALEYFVLQCWGAL
ncbi:MAG: DNA polymerase III subunit delta' [Aerococcus sp.]|nr:DNA polymerase III subunit delta' [Aerococcus sp.]